MRLHANAALSVNQRPQSIGNRTPIQVSRQNYALPAAVRMLT